MQFPAYIPEGAREHIRRRLEGDGTGWHGYKAYAAEYRAEGGADVALLAGWERLQACYLRFAGDPRMPDVYAELKKVFKSEDQYAGFLRSAWDANENYAPFRERVKKAKALTPKIAAAARELARLLDKLAETHTNPPSELYSIRALLNATDNHEMGGHNLSRWRPVRNAITGKPREPPSPEEPAPNTAAAPRQVIVDPEEGATEAERNNPDALIVRIRTFKPGEAGETDPKEDARDVLGYAWSVAPDLLAILETVGRTADKWTPQETGVIGAAIASQKQHPVMEYIRAFAKLLRDNLRPELASPILKAMAGTTNVVLNDPDVDVSADDVRMALKRAANDSEKK